MFIFVYELWRFDVLLDDVESQTRREPELEHPAKRQQRFRYFLLSDVNEDLQLETEHQPKHDARAQGQSSIFFISHFISQFLAILVGFIC